MNYPVTLPIQLRAVLRALRRSRALSQAQVGQLLGVNQQRVAKIENAPSVTSIQQIARLVAALGGRLVVEFDETHRQAGSKTTKTGKSRKAVAEIAKKHRDEW
jgi:HTH-type transcriptional regulator/antitoxin HipB